MLLTKLDGSPYDTGRATGERFPLAIWRVAAERMRQYHSINCDVPALMTSLDRRIEELADARPEAYEYLRGVADGSTVPLRSLVLFNFGEGLSTPASGCTIAGFQNTPSGPVVGGNLDDPAWQFLSLERPDDGYAALFVSLPGYFDKWGGMNEHGLCVTGSGAATAKPPAAAANPAAPFLVGPVRDILLRCRTVGEALALIQDGRYQHHNYMIGDAQQVVQIENRGEVVYREPEDTPLGIGNLKRSEFDAPGFEQTIPSLSETLQHHAGRNRLLRTVLLQHHPSATEEAMKRVLTAHGDDPDGVRTHVSICNFGTAVSLVGVPRDRRVWVSTMPPVCVNGYAEYRMDELLAAPAS